MTEGLHRLLHSPWLPAFEAGVVAIGVVNVTLMVVRRRRSGLPMFRPDLPDALFLEVRRSGRSLRTFFTRIGGARNCLWVAVSGGEFMTGLHFPFSVVGERSDLEHRVSLADVVSAERRASLSGRQGVAITFRHPGGPDKVVEVDVVDPDKLIAALGVAMPDQEGTP